MASSPGCSGISVSPGEPGPCIPGGVEEVFRVSVDEPLRDTQEVSITRTPILVRKTRVMYDNSNKNMNLERARWEGKKWEKRNDTVPLYLPNAALVGEIRGKRDTGS